MMNLSAEMEHLIESAKRLQRVEFKSDIITAIYEEIDSTLPTTITKEMTDIKYTEIDCGEKVRQALRRVFDKLTKEGE